ncbi:MAG: hypothetical protein JRD89_18635, partial [Deltaproteobacteria bacterium]|nr:hypothetical protein [Deltaproteobacteria bacterium]
MPSRTFVEKWVLNERTGSVNREIDLIRSGYPPTPASGYYHWTDSQVYTMLLSVPYVSGASIVSARIFRLQRMIVHNDQVPNKLVFYDGPGTSVTVFMM